MSKWRYYYFHANEDSVLLLQLKEIVLNDKLPGLRWKYEAKNDILLISFSRGPHIMLGKQQYCCHQEQDFSRNKKEMYRKQTNEVLKQDHIYKEKENISNQKSN